MRLENPLPVISPITGKLDQNQGLQTLVTRLYMVQSLILKNAETVSYLSLLFEISSKILIFKLI